jgi:hypothetical protein
VSTVAEPVAAPAVAVDWFKVNLKSVLSELTDAVPWRHEWENNRIHNAIDNIESDPVTILAKAEPRSPSQGQDNIQITALQASVAELTDLVHQLALGNAALQAKLAGTETVAPVAPAEPVAPVAPVAPAEPVQPIQGQ